MHRYQQDILQHQPLLLSASALVALMKSAADDPIVSDDFPLVADDFVKSRGSAALRVLLQRVMGSPKQITPFHRDLAKLAASGHIHTIITTNYDDLIERALTETQVPYILQTLQRNFDGVNPQTVRVIKLHGSIQDWETVILTGNSYASFEEKYVLLNKQLDVLCTQYPLTFIGSSLCEPRVLSWIAKRTPEERNNLMPWRALLTEDEWNKLLNYEFKGLQAKEILRGQFRPLIIDSHDKITALWSELAQRLAPTTISEQKINAVSSVPTIELDWPISNVPFDELDAFLVEAKFRAVRDQTPWFQISLLSLTQMRTLLSEIEKKETFTSEDRKKRIECLQNIEYFEEVQRRLTHCIEMIISDEHRKEVGWWVVPNNKLALILSELLQEPTKGNMRALLINRKSKIQTWMDFERYQLEEIFKCTLSNNWNFLSISDCPVPVDLSEVSWEIQWRAMGVILRKFVIDNINPLQDLDALHKSNWIISGD